MVYHNPESLKPTHTRNGTEPCTLLVGAGVVGRAILAEHLRHGLNVLLLDLHAETLHQAAEAVAPALNLKWCDTLSPLPGLAAVRLGTQLAGEWQPNLLIESIPENLELKQAFFATASANLDADCLLASNTSNLRVAEVFQAVADRSRCLGMHFFMPVGERPLVELIPCDMTAPQTLQACRQHAQQLGKDILITEDSPGFVVNRVLVPYLNQSLLLLGRGASPDSIAAAAQQFGMPLSPLELIDLIGIRTAFDSGRVFWRSFPKRIDPAPILSGMIKAGRLGAAFGGGFFGPDLQRIADQEGGPPIGGLHPQALAVIERYQRDVRVWTVDDIVAALSLAMWIEAAEILAAGVVDSPEAIELGLRGGLGYRGEGGFFAFFDRQGSAAILTQLQALAEGGALAAPAQLYEQLQRGHRPTEALLRYAHLRPEQAARSATGSET